MNDLPPLKDKRNLSGGRLSEYQNIKILAIDFDGVLTDNRVLTFQDGSEGVLCNRSDGLGFDMLRQSSIWPVVISTETNPVVSARCRKLNVACYSGVQDKLSQLKEIIAPRNVTLSECAYMGNDLNDLGIMSAVGLKICPSDAHYKVRQIADIVLPLKGGEGCLRYFVEDCLLMEL